MKAARTRQQMRCVFCFGKHVGRTFYCTRCTLLGPQTNFAFLLFYCIIRCPVLWRAFYTSWKGNLFVAFSWVWADMRHVVGSFESSFFLFFLRLSAMPVSILIQYLSCIFDRFLQLVCWISCFVVVVWRVIYACFCHLYLVLYVI